MASRVEGFDEAILLYAKKEFMEKGFNEASLRTIAKNAGVSTSTIYTRYVDKEGLFRHLVEPAARRLVEFVGRTFDSFEKLDESEQVKACEQYSDDGTETVIDILYDQFEDYKLLLTCGPSHYYQDFLEKIVELDVKCMHIFLKSIGSRSYLNGEITEGFLHVVTSAFYAGMFEVVIHDMPRKEAESYIDSLRVFYSSGWKAYY